MRCRECEPTALQGISILGSVGVSLMIRTIIRLFVAVTLLSAHFVFGQETKPTKLDEILVRLGQNLDFYDSRIPNFFCHEHVVSQLVYGVRSQQKQLTVTNSTFHLTRGSHPNDPPSLVESLENMTINGSPTQLKELQGRVVVSGVSARGLDAVSLIQEDCMRYSLGPSSINNGQELQVVNFESIPGRLMQSDCVLHETSAGRIFIDTSVMQVVRMEVTVPHDLIKSGYYGRWAIVVNHRPIQLGEHKYWLPQSIVSTLIPLDEEGTIWSFNADYTDYHKFEVTSRVRSFEKSDIP
jgi:hypothetical protein